VASGAGRGSPPRQPATKPLKSISKETTFHEDTADPDILDGHLWRLAEQVADRAKAKGWPAAPSR
jgi:DNA polymerase-4